MKKTDIIDQPKTTANPEVSILQEILQEIEAIPKEYWLNLLAILRAFRKTTTMTTTSISETNRDNQQQETDFLNRQHQELKKLTKQWLEEGDQEEQTETWQYLTKALEGNSLENEC